MSEGDRIFLLGNNATMPNLQGWSMRDVMYFSKLLKLDLKTSGTGYVTNQSIEKRTSYTRRRYIRTRIRTTVTTVSRGKYKLIQEI